MIVPKKVIIILYDVNKQEAIKISLEQVEEERIKWVLDTTLPVNAFAENYISLFKTKLEEKFKKIGARGIHIETLVPEVNQTILISSWAIKSSEESSLNKYVPYQSPQITKEELTDSHTITEYQKIMKGLLKKSLK